MDKLLDSLNKVNDIKEICPKDFPCLAKEIREFLLENISKTGGHLASNLGVVELTMALHYSFDIEKDKIVWDVGHQAYVHKMLTGRKDGFKTLRKLDGLSGFPKPSESKYDAFATGHSSTSISAALGIATARDLNRGNESVIAVIGDGSMTGGLAFEALNNAGRANTNLIVVLNDNQMSISNNVGAMPKYLNDLRTASAYLNAKAGVHKLLDKMPVVGKTLDKVIERVKDGVKYLFVSGVIFEELGFKYIGPIDGHDTEELIEVFNKIKNIKGPVLLHVKTTKGKGYRFAEKLPWDYHGVGSFDIKTGTSPSKKAKPSFSKVFGDTMMSIGKKNEKLVAISAAMASGTGLEDFQLAYPNRFFDVAIAEQHAVTFSAGLASGGLIPVFAVYSTFLQRAYDQLMVDVCLQKLHVIFAIDRAGIVGADGETHQGIFDISFLYHIPNLTIMAPKNGAELKSMLEMAVEMDGPVAIRYPRSNAEEDWYCGEEISYGIAEIDTDGNEIAIIACGTMFDTAKEVCEKLKADGKNPMLVNPRFIKPIDSKTTAYICKKCKYIFTIEDNVVKGGFGSVVNEEISNQNITGVRLTSFGFPDKFIEQGTREQLFGRYSLDTDGILRRINDVINER
ncbi:MAG TPA: 1-deoxy-D-xylulose-5-phosphate synthase [Lachnospiraceae bacterium]|nr:1-deoxy-D-xylulose-5-phosphate synthase [Lachnospiraceae bacterium]